MSLLTAKKNIFAATRTTGSFTLIEILVSVGILVVLVSITILGLGAYKGRTSFDMDVSQVVAVLRSAQSRAISQDRGQGWGVQFVSDTDGTGHYFLFSGIAYATSSVVAAGTLEYSSSFSDPAPGFSKTIVFAPMTGAPAGADGVVIKNSTTNTVGIISVSALGLISQTTESGLAAYWPMDEGAGTDAYDASGNGNNGTLLGFTFSGLSNWTAGKAGAALGFSGSSYVSSSEGVFPGGPLDFNDTSMTISFWMQTQASGVEQDVVARQQSFAAGILSNNDLFGSTNFGSGQFDSGYVVSPSTWYFVTYVSGPANQLVYVNGALVASSTSPGSLGTPLTGTTIIGGGATHPFTGIIDDLRVYNRILSAQEIQNVFNSY